MDDILKKFDKISLTIYIYFIIFFGYNFIEFLTVVPFVDGENCFAFWYSITHHSSNITYLMIFLPLIVAFITTKLVSFKKKNLKAEIINLIKKIIYPFLILNISIFTTGILFISHEIIDNGNASYKEAFFDYQLVGNPYLFVLLKLISSIFFILTVINIALLSAKLCKNKKPETMFLTFLLVNVFNILLHLIVYELIGKNFGDDISKYTYLMNFYEGYVIENNIITSLINSFIYLILSIIPLKFIFKRR